MFNKLKKLDEHTLEVILKSSASLVVRVLGMAIGLVVSIVLGRTLGPDGFGLFNLSERIITLLSVFVYFGMDNVVRKEVAIAYDRGAWEDISNTVHTAFWITVPLASILAVILILLAPFLSKHIFSEERLIVPLLAAIIMLPSLAARQIYASAMIGFRKIWQSNLLNDSVTTITVALSLLAFWIMGLKVTLLIVVLTYAASKAVCFVLVTCYWKTLHIKTKNKKFIVRPMLKTGLPMMLVMASAMAATSIDTIMLGWLATSTDVGVYSVASRLALLTSLFRMVIISTLTPKIASLHAQNKTEALEQMVCRTTTVLLILAILSFVFFVVFGEILLSLWGPEFSIGYSALLILCIGQFVFVSTGAAGTILLMTGHQTTLSKIIIISAVLNIILNLYLIPIFGLIGAAASTAISISLSHYAELLTVNKKLGLKVISLSWIKRKRV